MYSYGILLLEMFTRKSPTDTIFMKGLSLQKFVEIVFPQPVTDVTNAHLLSLKDEEEINDTKSTNGARAIKCITSCFKLESYVQMNSQQNDWEWEKLSRNCIRSGIFS